ncbi:hypothetical protein [Engelhardtia mirabilis]|uniref:DUF5666 domain-containing protein n=1 Tax=Engelhardtia mirabilis TaxID=2528011 RepID=A0A518BN20_9BACT|nr:hypothetical protein Pla133_34290 [Planctomycetes bacterium Pla133]QDV02659.1 hypothetical protein Pla86_34280 [Planctomycetes bacterium Pla86]
MQTTLLAPIALFVLSTSALAQEVTFTGKVEDVSGTTNQFVLGCTDTQLTSAFFNLNLFVGEQVQITGQWNGSAANPSVAVDAISVVPEVFEIGGGTKIGKTSTLGFTAAPGSGALGFISLNTSFTPFGAEGVIFIDQSQIVLSASGTVGGAGVLQIPFQIPNSPALVGLDIYGQGAVVAGGLVSLTNPDCKTIDN